MVMADGVPFPKPVHHRQGVEELGKPLRIPQPCGRLCVVFGEMQRIGEKERVQAGRGARRRISGLDRRKADLGLGHPELAEQRRRRHRGLRDALTGSGDRLGRKAYPLLVLAGEQERTQERTVQAVAERQLPLAKRGGKMEAGGGAQLVGAQQRVPLGSQIHHCCHCCPGAPVNPDAGPIPSISSHRGQDCDGRPWSARSMTSSVIFSTTCEK